MSGSAENLRCESNPNDAMRALANGAAPILGERRARNADIRIATYNVHGCVGTDRKHDPARVSRVIAEIDADVIAIQEFSYPSDVALETRAPVVLSELDDYECALGPTLARKMRYGPRETHRYGNLLLTRHPIREVERIDLSVDRREPRGALAVTIDVDGTELHVLATHLGLRVGERRFQIGKLLAHLDQRRAEFCAILGDFNDWLPGRTVARVLDERYGPVPRARSFPARWPLVALDRIWIQPRERLQSLTAHDTELARRASDHLPIVARLARDLPRA